MLRAYPFYRGYNIYWAEPNQSATIPPKGQMAIYAEQLEAGLRIPTTQFLRDNLRYWGIWIIQIAPNAIQIPIWFEMLCWEQRVNHIVNLFQKFYMIKNNENEKDWFNSGTHSKHIQKLVIDSPTLIKRWKNHFVFVSNDDFSNRFWRRPHNAPTDPSLEFVKEQNFQNFKGSSLKNPIRFC